MTNNFPVKTATGCRLKWSYSTIYLSRATTASCHRVDQDNLTLENFMDFHNLPRKIKDREMMLEGKWPGGGCEYCKDIEQAGGFSDRQFHLTDKFDHMTVKELLIDPTATKVTPRTLEVYFNNTCNLKCVYCGPWFSSKIAAELKKHGSFGDESYNYLYDEWQMNPQYEKMVNLLFEWLAVNHQDLTTFQILGGEPFLQKEFDRTLDFFETHPNPNMTFVIISNLAVDDKRIDHIIERFERLIGTRKLKDLQITGSLDCWGPQAEYIRSGLDLSQWQRNFEKLHKKKWIRMQINHAISVLSVKYMPDLLRHMQEWNEYNQVFNNFMAVQWPKYLNPGIFGADLFREDFEIINDLMLDNHPHVQASKKYMQGIQAQIANTKPNIEQIKSLKTFLDTIDHRRNKNYKELFPWLDVEFAKYL
jgi:hypothetical protein